MGRHVGPRVSVRVFSFGRRRYTLQRHAAPPFRPDVRRGWSAEKNKIKILARSRLPAKRSTYTLFGQFQHEESVKVGRYPPPLI